MTCFAVFIVNLLSRYGPPLLCGPQRHCCHQFIAGWKWCCNASKMTPHPVFSCLFISRLECLIDQCMVCSDRFEHTRNADKRETALLVAPFQEALDGLVYKYEYFRVR